MAAAAVGAPSVDAAAMAVMERERGREEGERRLLGERRGRPFGQELDLELEALVGLKKILWRARGVGVVRLSFGNDDDLGCGARKHKRGSVLTERGGGGRARTDLATFESLARVGRGLAPTVWCWGFRAATEERSRGWAL
ncbi:uncharacterized protein A4U43_C09F13390 [Asparagus officinalis]|uniref:Uncharacterized protein n=1 Tax=Asparagus officinalis TaxID=4686 RepID=A0A5P1E769_ASPOF|nr:uncharacterized protein A4U43_C09F13390 [Asparagus officinalis]